MNRNPQIRISSEFEDAADPVLAGLTAVVSDNLGGHRDLGAGESEVKLAAERDGAAVVRAELGAHGAERVVLRAVFPTGVAGNLGDQVVDFGERRRRPARVARQPTRSRKLAPRGAPVAAQLDRGDVAGAIVDRELGGVGGDALGAAGGDEGGGRQSNDGHDPDCQDDEEVTAHAVGGWLCCRKEGGVVEVG